MAENKWVTWVITYNPSKWSYLGPCLYLVFWTHFAELNEFNFPQTSRLHSKLIFRESRVGSTVGPRGTDGALPSTEASGRGLSEEFGRMDGWMHERTKNQFTKPPSQVKTTILRVVMVRLVG